MNSQLMKRIILFALFIFPALSMYAQDSAGFKFSIDHLALSVKDVNRSADFYINVMKLTEITNRSKIDGIRWFVLGDGRELHLISVIKENVTLNKAVHLGLSSGKFDDFVKLLATYKIPYSDWLGKANMVNIRADGIKQVFFQDPDGYWIEVNSLNK